MAEDIDVSTVDGPYTETSMYLTYPDIQEGHSFTNVLLVDSSVKDYQVFVDAASPSTFPIVYSSHSSKSELLTLLQTHFAVIKRIGLCFVSKGGDATELFLDNRQFSFGENKEYLVNIINTFQVKNMDFLACDTLQSPVWNDYYTQLTQATSVIVGASDDKTGNIKYGGDWIMESTSEDLESIYFNQNIGYYNYLLDITLTFLTFAALKGDGSVVAWGAYGGTAPSSVTSAGSNVVHIYSNQYAFAALKGDGSVVVWGDATSGGSLTSPVDVASQLGAGSNVIHIYSNNSAFAALKSDGTVVAWGNATDGGTAPSGVKSAGSNVVHIYSNITAFAALKGDGSVVAWGGSNGGNAPSTVTDAGSNVVHIYSNNFVFAALKSDGTVVAWGSASFGANAPSSVSNAGSNVVHIYSNGYAFADLKGDGSVVAWGDTSKGGNPPSSVTNAGSNVIHIYGNGNAFAALKSDGSVVVWGDGNFGGSLTSPVDVASQLGAGSNVIRIFPSSPYSRSDVNPLPVIGNTITVPTTGPALRLTSGLAVQNRAARKAFVRELITNNSIALATTGVKMVVDAAAFLNSSIRSTITKSKVNLVTSSTLSGGEFDTTTSLASDEALYAPLENIGDFIVIKLPSGNKIKFEKSSLTEYNVYEDSDNNMTPTATLLEGVVGTFENFNYVTGSVTGEIEPPFAVSGKLGWNLVGATKTGDVFDSSNIIITMVTYNTDSKSYVSVDLINGKRTVTEGNGYFVNYSQDGFVEILKNW